MALLLCAPAAHASLTKTINFESPVLPEGAPVVITSQYSAEGLAFISPFDSPVHYPSGSGEEPFARAELERDPERAYDSSQLIVAYEHEGIEGPDECAKAWSDLAGRLTQSGLEGSEKISVYVGAGPNYYDKAGGGKILLDAYNGHGELLGSDEKEAGTAADTHLEVTDNLGGIDFFYVIAPDGGRCDTTPTLESTT